MPSTLVTDTSVLYAALDPADRSHRACTALLGSGVAVATTPAVLGEVDWLARTRGRPRATELLLDSVLDDSVLVVDLDRDDYERVAELVHRYADLPLSFVDAAVIAVAERLEQDTIATLDRRHFTAVRPRHCRRFSLVP